MKTTLELPDQLFRRAKVAAAERGQTLKEFVTEALRDKLSQETAREYSAQPEWMKGFGKLKRLRRETARVQSRVDQEFETIDPEDER
jgi:hypothetical protein